MFSTAAFFWLYFDWAASSSAGAITLRPARSCARSKSFFANSASACAERICASSADASSCSKMSPFFTSLPESKSISATVPASSALIIAPCTGETEPTADSIGCQSPNFTSALVTVVGGGTIFLPAETRVMICQALIPPRRSSTASRPRTTFQTLLVVGFMENENFEGGLAMSCISGCFLRLEK